MEMVGRIAQLLVVVLLAATCAGDERDDSADGQNAPTVVSDPPGTGPDTVESPAETTTDPPAQDLGYRSEIYADPEHWLCLPDRADDACDIDLTTTRIDQDGTRSTEAITPDPVAPIDCFYVYPTVSDEMAPNSGLVPTESERRAVAAQAAHLQVSCRLYAPMYRQITRPALFRQVEGIPDRGLAFGDVVDAWHHYLAEFNHGRGVVLIGHSQGAGHLRELLVRHVDTDERVRDLLVSAVLLGTTVRLPSDGPTGADFEHLEPCTARDQVGCVLSWSSYAVDDPPGIGGFFGGVGDSPHLRVVCTNPAALEGGPAPLDSIVPANPLRDVEVATPWVRYVGLAEAECVETDTHHYLELRYPPDTPDGVPSELGGRLGGGWGLHLIDGQVALGDLARLIADQGRAHASAR